MDTVYKKVPFTKDSFDQQEEEQLESFICPLHKQHQRFPGQQTRQTRTNFLTRPHQVEDDEEDVTPFYFFSQMQQKPWFTVVPLGGVVRPEEVKVKINPLCRLLVIKATPLMQRNYLSRTSTKQIHRIVTLPKNIRMEQLHVKLTQRGELVIMAPFKSQQGQETPMTPFFEQGRDLLSSLKWITIPIVNNRENTIRSTKKRQQPFFPFQEESESESSSSEEESTDEEETESESEEETEDEDVQLPRRRGQQEETTTSNIRTIKFQVQKYVQLLQKIFYPNIVVAKIIRDENTTTTQQLLVALDVKFVDFRAEEINVRMHETKRVLIVEAKKMRQFREPTFGTTLKYVRREFELPQWLDVKKIVYRVLATGVLRIKLPLLTNTFQQHGNQTQRIQYQHQQKMGCPCQFNFNAVNKRCPEYKQYKKPVRAFF